MLLRVLFHAVFPIRIDAELHDLASTNPADFERTATTQLANPLALLRGGVTCPAFALLKLLFQKLNIIAAFSLLYCLLKPSGHFRRKIRVLINRYTVVVVNHRAPPSNILWYFLRTGME